MRTKEILIVFVFFGMMSSALFAQQDIDQRLDSFSQNLRWHHHLENVSFLRFVEISDSQRESFKSLEKEYRNRLLTVKRNSKINNKSKFEEMSDLKIEFNRRFQQEILLKVQREQMSNWMLYSSARNHGIGCCLVNGWIARRTQLSKKERESIVKNMKNAHDRYIRDVIKAQKKAMSLLVKDLPDEKRRRVAASLKAISFEDGMQWPIEDSHFLMRDPQQMNHSFGFKEILTIKSIEKGEKR